MNHILNHIVSDALDKVKSNRAAGKPPLSPNPAIECIVNAKGDKSPVGADALKGVVTKAYKAGEDGVNCILAAHYLGLNDYVPPK